MTLTAKVKHGKILHKFSLIHDPFFSYHHHFGIGYRSPLRPVPWDVIPELSSISDSAQREYQGEVVEINIEGRNRNDEYLCNGTKSVTESGEDDPSWWEEAVKFADSIENTDHGPDTRDQVGSLFCCLLLLLPASISKRAITETAIHVCAQDKDCDDADWWMDAERIMVQIEEQIGSQSNA
jgi:hypothetical protein